MLSYINSRDLFQQLRELNQLEGPYQIVQVLKIVRKIRRPKFQQQEFSENFREIPCENYFSCDVLRSHYGLAKNQVLMFILWIHFKNAKKKTWFRQQWKITIQNSNKNKKKQGQQKINHLHPTPQNKSFSHHFIQLRHLEVALTCLPSRTPLFHGNSLHGCIDVKPSAWSTLAGGSSSAQNMVFQQLTINENIHPGRLTWNLQITHLERNMIFQASMRTCSMLIFQGVHDSHILQHFQRQTQAISKQSTTKPGRLSTSASHRLGNYMIGLWGWRCRKLGKHRGGSTHMMYIEPN